MMDGENGQIKDLTEEEKEYLFGKWRCPDCGDSHFFHGPQGGLSENIMCGTC